MENAHFEKLSTEASKAIIKAEDTLSAMFPVGTHGTAFIRYGQVNPSPATVRGIAYGTGGAKGYLVIELDTHKDRSRFTYRDVHYTKFIPDQA